MTKHNTISQENLKYSYRAGRLPHLFDVDKPIFITFRLKFTLPEAIINELERRKHEWLDEKEKLNEAEKQKMNRRKEGLFFAWFDKLLDTSPDIPKILHQEEITDIVASSLRYFDGKRYKLLAYCIMPNHVHVLIFPLRDTDGNMFSLAGITYSWKRFTSNRINKLLNKSGSLWLRESFDRLVRDEEELTRTVDYIVQNPVKAGLAMDWEGWRGSYLCEELRPRSKPVS
jgi:REP element-mobilizing transposase RayT